MASHNQPTRSLVPGLVLAACLLAPWSVQAGLFDDEEARKAILELRARVNENNRNQAAQIDGLNKQVLELNARLDQASRGQLEAQTQMELLRQDIARLRGLLEVQLNYLTSELGKTQRAHRDLASDVDTRVKRFEPVQVMIDGKPANVDPAEKRMFDAALSLFRAGEFRAAQLEFMQLLAQFPSTAYGPQSSFWIGSAQFGQKDYRGALATHQGLLAKHPDHPRAADAALSVGLSQLELGDRRAAKASLQQVVEKFGDSPAAQTAKDRLNTPALANLR
jgi:tol-pal system protein YbgF